MNIFISSGNDSQSIEKPSSSFFGQMCWAQQFFMSMDVLTVGRTFCWAHQFWPSKRGKGVLQSILFLVGENINTFYRYLVIKANVRTFFYKIVHTISKSPELKFD